MDALDSQQNDLQLALARLDSLVGFVERTVERTVENASNEESLFP